MFLLLLNSSLYAQVPLETIFEVAEKTVPLPKGKPSSLSVDQEHNLFVLESENHRIFKYFAQAEYDSVLTIGGKGINSEGLNFPTKLVVQNRQSTYLLDFQNRRILLLNVNLKVTREINFLELVESNDGLDLFPMSFSISPVGDLFVLNQDDYKIYKYNTFRQLETSFGGMDYGLGSLQTPDDMVMNNENLLFVSDTSHQRVSVFDMYGIFQYHLYPETAFRWKRITTLDNYLICFDDKNVFIRNLFTKKYRNIPLSEDAALIDVVAIKNFIYLLFENKVNLYRF